MDEKEKNQLIEMVIKLRAILDLLTEFKLKKIEFPGGETVYFINRR